MIRTLLILLFAIVSSSALADQITSVQTVHHHPVGPCQITQQVNGPSIHFNVFNGYGNFIASYSDYQMAMNAAIHQERMGSCHGIRTTAQHPPQPPMNFCQIFQARDAYGRFFFRVVDRYGRILYQTPFQNEAVRLAQQDSRCYQ